MVVEYFKHGWTQTFKDGRKETWVWKNNILFLKASEEILA